MRCVSSPIKGRHLPPPPSPTSNIGHSACPVSCAITALRRGVCIHRTREHMELPTNIYPALAGALGSCCGTLRSCTRQRSQTAADPLFSLDRHSSLQCRAVSTTPPPVSGAAAELVRLHLPQDWPSKDNPIPTTAPWSTALTDTTNRWSRRTGSKMIPGDIRRPPLPVMSPPWNSPRGVPPPAT